MMDDTSVGAIAVPGPFQAGFWRRWALRLRCLLLPRPCLVAELVRGGQWEALDRLCADLDGEG